MSDSQYAKAGRIMFLAVWLIFFGLMFLFFYYYNKTDQGNYQISAGKVTITPDKYGHYYIDGYINNSPVKFMLDTGATWVAVPANVATQINLKGHYPVTVKTAAGEVTGSLTRLDTLAFADFKFQNIKAVIVPADDENIVLLGMNILSKFDLSQKGKQLILRNE